MQQRIPYEDIVEMIAIHVHRISEDETSKVGHTVRRVFDDMSTSSLQIAAGVLEKLDIVQETPPRSGLWYFVCEPECFKEAAFEKKQQGCSYDTLILSVLCLVEYGLSLPFTANKEMLKKDSLLGCLSELGLCEPPILKSRSIDLPDGALQIPELSVVWTEKKAFYDELYRDWPTLI